MSDRIPSKEKFVFRKVTGSDFLEFAQRIFSRQLKNLTLGEGRLCLLLTPQGKLAQMFWLVQEAETSFIIIHSAQALNWKDQVEAYQFSENFQISEPIALQVSWSTLLESSARAEGRLSSTSQFEGFWKNTRFLFQWETKISEQADWDEYRWTQGLVDPAWDANEERLVFDWGLEDLCDPQKGCYVGQEIVERVKSRGGQSAFQIFACEWLKEPNAPEDCFQSNQLIGKHYRLLDHPKRFLSFGFFKKSVKPELNIVGGQSGSEAKLYPLPVRSIGEHPGEY